MQEPFLDFFVCPAAAISRNLVPAKYSESTRYPATLFLHLPRVASLSAELASSQRTAGLRPLQARAYEGAQFCHRPPSLSLLFRSRGDRVRGGLSWHAFVPSVSVSRSIDHPVLEPLQCEALPPVSLSL